MLTVEKAVSSLGKKKSEKNQPMKPDGEATLTTNIHDNINACMHAIMLP